MCDSLAFEPHCYHGYPFLEDSGPYGPTFHRTPGLQAIPLQATPLNPAPHSPIEDMDDSWHSLTGNLSSSVFASVLVNLTVWLFCGRVGSVRKQVWKLLACGTGQADGGPDPNQTLHWVCPHHGMNGSSALPDPHAFGLSQGGCCDCFGKI